MNILSTLRNYFFSHFHKSEPQVKENPGIEVYPLASPQVKENPGIEVYPLASGISTFTEEDMKNYYGKIPTEQTVRIETIKTLTLFKENVPDILKDENGSFIKDKLGELVYERSWSVHTYDKTPNQVAKDLAARNLLSQISS